MLGKGHAPFPLHTATEKNTNRTGREIVTKGKTVKACSLTLAVAVLLTGMAGARKVSASAALNEATLIEHEELAQEIARNGMVLLENRGALPLTSSDRVVGTSLGQIVYGGAGSGLVSSSRRHISYTDALTEAAQKKLIASYTDSIRGDGNKCIIFISRASQEDTDISASSFNLSSAEKSRLTEACGTFGAENVIAVLNVGSVIDTTYLKNLKLGAIVLAYYGGNTAGTALADCLTGQSNFSGKTVDTWAASYADYPSVSVGEFGVQNNVQYTEDVYVGYRYFSTFDPDYEKVNYPFGYGLSYTQFALSEQAVSVEGDEVTARVKVTNVGDVEGREVVQLYYQSPESVKIGEETVFFGAPARELGGFQKTRLLKPNESETVSIRFPVSDMAVYDDMGKIEANTYQLLAGDYQFYLGTNVRDADKAFAGYQPYTVAQTTAVSEKLTVLSASQLDERLLSNGEKETVGMKQIAPYGSTTIQGENFNQKAHLYNTRGGDVSTNEANLGVNCFYFVGQIQGHTGEWLDYKVNVEKAGEYSVGLGMANANNGGGRFVDAVTFYVNGVKQIVKYSYISNDWLIFTYAAAEGTLTLPAGEVTIRLENKSGQFSNLDFFTIYNNAVSPDAPTVIEAETLDAETPGLKVVCYGDNGAVVVNTANKNIAVPANAEKAGDYYVRLKASNVKNASDRTAVLSVGGAEIGAFSLMRTSFADDYAQAANNFRFTYTNSVKVTLPAGETELLIETKDANLYALDAVEIIPAENGAPEYTFKNNTDEVYSPAENESYDASVTYSQLVEGKIEMDTFLGALSAQELIAFTGLERPLGFSYGGAGALGNGAWNGKLDRGVPRVYTTDAAAGVGLSSKGNVVWFPCATLIASTFDEELTQEYGRAVAEEAASFGFNVWLAPSVNIHRNPLCGRNFEYYSEYPIVAGKIGAAVVKGAQSRHVAVCVKHFAVNNQETTRFTSNSCVSNRAIREIYLKAFEIIVKESNPWAIMSSYNRLNGEYVAATRELITDVLRGEWGFDGAVFSDWWCYNDHAAMLGAGNNIKCDNPDYAQAFRAYEAGFLSRETLEENAKDVLTLMLRVGGAEHYFEPGWVSDETSHWHPAACGHDVKGDAAEHDFVNGKCSVCGYEKSTTIPPEPEDKDDTPKESKAWIGWTVGGCAAVLVAAGVVTFVLLKKKKK